MEVIDGGEELRVACADAATHKNATMRKLCQTPSALVPANTTWAVRVFQITEDSVDDETPMVHLRREGRLRSLVYPPRRENADSDFRQGWRE